MEVSFQSKDYNFQKIVLPKEFRDFDRVELAQVFDALVVSLLHPKHYAKKCPPGEDIRKFVPDTLLDFFKEVYRVMKEGAVLSINDIVAEKQDDFVTDIIGNAGFGSVSIRSALHDHGSFCQIFMDIKGGAYIQAVKH